MNKSLRKVIYWGAALSIYALIMAVVIQLLSPEHRFVTSLSETAALAIERNDSTGSLIDEVGQSETLSGVFIPLGPDEGHLPGSHAVWDEFKRVLQSNKKNKTSAGFDGIQAVEDVRDFSIGAVSEIFFSGVPRQVFHRGHLLYLLNDKQQVLVVNCKDPREPRLMATLPYLDVSHMEMHGTIAYMLLERKEAQTGSLLIVDLENPAKPRELARLGLPGGSSSLFFVNSQLVVFSSKRGAVGENYVYLYDLDDRFQLSLLGSVESPDLGDRFLQYDNYILIPELHEGLSVYDFSEPLHLELVAYLNVSKIDRLARNDDVVFASGFGGDLSMIELEDPLHPALSTVVGEKEHHAFFMEHDNYTYFFTFNGYLRVFDFSAMAFQAPVDIQETDSDEPMSLSPEEKFVLFGKPPVSLPSAVVGGASVASIETVDHLFWKGSMVLLDSHGTLYSYGEDDDSSSALWQSLQLANSPQWLAAGDDYLYAGGNGFVSVVAFNVDGAASVLGQVDLSVKESWDGLVIQKTLFVAAGKDGLLAYSLQQPDAPVVSTGWVAPRHLKSQVDIRQLVAAEDGRVFFTAGKGGLFGGRMDAEGRFRLQGDFRFSDAVSAFAIHDGLALVSTGKSICVVDVGDEYSFQNLGKIAFSGVTKIAASSQELWAGYSATTGGWSALPFPRFLMPGDRNLLDSESHVSPTGSRYKLHVFNDSDVKIIAGTVTLPGYQAGQANAGGAIVH